MIQFRVRIETYAYRGSGGDAWMLFHKDEKDKITHFTVWDPRLMHHRFDKFSK